MTTSNDQQHTKPGVVPDEAPNTSPATIREELEELIKNSRKTGIALPPPHRVFWHQ